MALINASVYNIINTVCDFFTEVSDNPICSDQIINQRMRELMLQNPKINQGILLILSELVTNMQSNPQYDHYNLEHFEIFPELVVIMSTGWFNYDKYIKQYSEHEIGDLVYMKIQETIVYEAERLYNSIPSIDDLLTMLKL